MQLISGCNQQNNKLECYHELERKAKNDSCVHETKQLEMCDIIYSGQSRAQQKNQDNHSTASIINKL